MAKDMNELNTRVPHVSSRSEQYLNYLVGRATTLDTLPDKPGSRVEEYLELLCYLRGQGGGGGQPFNGVTNVTYNAQTKQLVVTHSNGLITNLDLSNLSDVTDVQYNDNTHIMTVTRNGVPTQIDLSKLNTKINNVAPVDGNINLGLDKTGDNITLTVEGGDVATISLDEYAKTVNGQPSINGNVTVDAEHIPYDKNTSQLNATDVQGAIDELNGKFVSDITFEDTTRTLKKTINGIQTDVVSGIVKKWEHLEDVNEYPYANLLEYNKKVTGFAYTGNGDAWREDSRWSTAFIDVEEGKVYTVFRKHQDSNRFIYTNSVGGRKINADTVNSNWNSNGFNGRAFTIPRGQNITKVAIMFQHGLNAIDEIMIFEGEIREIPGFIPFADKALIQIGTKVSHKFDNEGSNLKSTTLSSAIKEIEIEVNNKVSQDEVTVLSDANKIVRLDGNGKLDLSVIPNFSINRVHPVLDEQKALELIDNNTAQVGDIFILTNRNNSVYMYVNENGIDFDNKCVELTMADGTVKSVNGVFADDTGNVTIGIDNIATLRNELNLRLKSINGQIGVDGNVDLSCENTNEKIDFKVKNEIFATITYITDNQVQEIKDLFTF